MPVLSEADMKRIRTAFRDTLGTAIETPKVYRLGRLLPDGRVEVNVPNAQTPGMVWVRGVGENAGDAVPAVNSVLRSDELIPNSYVECEPFNGGLRVTRAAPQNALFAGDVNVRPTQPIDIYLLDVGLLRSTSPPSMFALVTSAQRELDGVLYYQPTLVTKDFTDDRPATAGTARAVLVEIVPATNTLHYTPGMTFDARLSLSAAHADYLPRSLAPDRFPVGHIKLAAGQTIIRRQDILPFNGLLSRNRSSDPFANAVWGADNWVYVAPGALLEI